MKDVWVSKSELVHFRQCPYAFSMLHLGLVTPDSPVERPVTFPNHTRRLFKRHGWRWTADKATFRNPELKIAGRPHGIDPADGGMVPIVVMGWGWLQIPGEVDDLRQINTMDRWSLAFSWLLLQPRRTRTDMEPTGWAIRDREIKLIRLADTLEDVRFAIEQARGAKTALSPWSCVRCEICQTHAGHAAMIARDQHSLRLLQGISFRDSLRFAQHGVRTPEDLLGVEDGLNVGVAPRRLAALKLSCTAVINHQPMIRKPLDVALDPDNLIVLDTEHGGVRSEGLWLISVRICRRAKISDHLLWIEPDADERPQIRKMMELLRTYPDLPVATWSGPSADIAQFARAAARWKMVGWRTLHNWLPELERRHVDLRRLVREHLALPIPRLGLNEVAAYLGVRENPVTVRLPSYTGDGQREEIQITNGRAAVRVQEHYAMAAKKDKTYLKTALCEYAQQDLAMTHEVARRVLEIHKGAPSEPKA